MNKINAILLMAFIVIGSSGVVLADGHGQSCEIQGDTGYIRYVISRMNSVDLTQEQFNHLAQRIRLWISSHRVCRPIPGNPNL